MTSERFWEVTEGYFAEGHKEGWLDKLLAIEHLPKNDDPVFAIPDPKTDRKEKEKGEGEGAGAGAGDKPKSPKPSSSPKVRVDFFAPSIRLSAQGILVHGFRLERVFWPCRWFLGVALTVFRKAV